MGRARPIRADRKMTANQMTDRREERRTPHQVGFQPAGNRKPTPFKLAHGGGDGGGSVLSVEL